MLSITFFVLSLYSPRRASISIFNVECQTVLHVLVLTSGFDSKTNENSNACQTTL